MGDYSHLTVQLMDQHSFLEAYFNSRIPFIVIVFAMLGQ